MNSALRLITAFAAGAAAMYYLDPATGRRRRNLARDQAIAAGHDVEHYARAKSRRVAGRARGVLANVKASVSRQPVDDEQLHDRVRARLGHLVERPAAIEVRVDSGHVALHGSALAPEIDAAVRGVARIGGVESVDSQLIPR